MTIWKVSANSLNGGFEGWEYGSAPACAVVGDNRRAGHRRQCRVQFSCKEAAPAQSPRSSPTNLTTIETCTNIENRMAEGAAVLFVSTIMPPCKDERRHKR